MNRIAFALLTALALAAGAFAQPAATPKPPAAKPAKVQTIAHGREVKLASFVSPGRTTVFDFSSEYCPPCRALAPQLDRLHQRRPDVVVVKVNVNRPEIRGIDWKSPVARQYDLRSLPHLKVFGPDGRLQAEGKEARALVNQWIRELSP